MSQIKSIRKRLKDAEERNEDTPIKPKEKTPKKSPLLRAIKDIQGEEEDVADNRIEKTPVSLHFLKNKAREEEDTTDSIIDSLQDNNEEEHDKIGDLFDF